MGLYTIIRELGKERRIHQASNSVGINMAELIPLSKVKYKLREVPQALHNKRPGVVPQ